MKKLMAIAVLGTLGVAAQAQAQSVQELQDALSKAQKAAADAQLAATQAQQALVQVQQAARDAQASAAAGAATAKDEPSHQADPLGSASAGPSGLVYHRGGDTVRLYGLIDLSMSRQTNADAAGHSQNDMSVAWFSGNRWGIEGEHLLADTDGLKAVFKLESEYEIPTGNMDTPGVLFNRDAWLGLQSPTLGKLTFGRQNTLAREFSKIYGDAYGSAGVTYDEGGYTNNNDFKQFIFYSGSATGTRYDKGIVWKKAYGKIMAGLAYQVGGEPGNNREATTKSVALAYNGGALNVSGFYNTAVVSDYTHTSWSIGGNYKIGMVRLNTGYVHYTAEQPKAIGDRHDNAYTISAKFAPGGHVDYELGWQTMNATNAAVNGAGYVLNAYADTSAAKATGTGKRKTWYGSVFYHFDKRTELYLASDYLSTDGSYKAAQAHGADSQFQLATGLRFRF
ncbi:porin [Massilia sp. 2TAF26]|uniref:porin n=1 Tax=Massilia sp. 2TAF26 TaxID=3233012 RepID=UPI003F9E47E3